MKVIEVEINVEELQDTIKKLSNGKNLPGIKQQQKWLKIYGQKGVEIRIQAGQISTNYNYIFSIIIIFTNQEDY